MNVVISKARRGLMRRRQVVAQLVFDNGKNFAHTETYNNLEDAKAAVELAQRELGSATVQIVGVEDR